MNRNKKTKKISIVLSVIVSFVILAIVLAFTNSKNVTETVKDNNFKYSVETLTNKAKIKKYSSSAECITINKEDLSDEYNITGFESNAFNECYNLDKILIDKEIVDSVETFKIDDFEQTGESEDGKYIEFTTTREYSDLYQVYAEQTDEEKEKWEVIPRKYDIPAENMYSEEMEEKYNVSELQSETLPTSFSLRDKIAIDVENQKSFGTCYAYATLQTVETNLALTTGKYVDLSEIHLACLTEFGGYGGFFERDTGSYYTDEIGPVYEEDCAMDDIYGKSDTELNKNINKYLSSENYGLTSEQITNIKNELKKISPAIKVVETTDFPSFSKKDNLDSVNELGRKIVKKHIMEYGSVYSSIAYASDLSTNLNINGTKTNVSHAVSIIGWDDNYSKENFDNKPENDGAWLALNSWGEDWGNSGYFWISYEDDYVNTGLCGTVQVEEYSNNITIDSFKLKNKDNQSYYEGLKITKGENAQGILELGVDEIYNDKYEFNISVISPSGNDVTNKFVISGNNISNKKATITFDFNSKELDSGNYNIKIEYNGEETIVSFMLDEGLFDYYLNDNQTITITGYNGDDTEIVIPETYNGYNVTRIGTGFSTFEMQTVYKAISGITIGKNITEIEFGATMHSCIIYGYKNSAAERYIQNHAYSGLRFAYLDNDNKTTEFTGNGWRFDISTHKLYVTSNTCDCNWQISNSIYEIVIDNSVSTFNGSIQGKNLTKITMSDNIKVINEYAFTQCGSLSEINMPSKLEEIKTGAFIECCSLKSITLPNSLKNIGEEAFYRCYNLENINLSNSIIKIGDNAFAECCKLKEITLPNSLKEIGEGAFCDCASLKDANIPNGLETLGNEAFYGCVSLEELVIPENITSFGTNVFKNAKLTLKYNITKTNKTIEMPNILRKLIDESPNQYYYYGLIINGDTIEYNNSEVSGVYVYEGKMNGFTISFKFNITDDEEVVINYTDENFAMMLGKYITDCEMNLEEKTITTTKNKILNVTSLSIEDMVIKDFTGIEKLANLNNIWINDCEIGDLSKITQLTNITNLTLYDCSINNLSSILNEFNTLKYIYINNIKLDNSNFIYNNDLEYIGLNYTGVDDVDINYLLEKNPDITIYIMDEYEIQDKNQDKIILNNMMKSTLNTTINNYDTLSYIREKMYNNDSWYEEQRNFKVADGNYYVELDKEINENKKVGKRSMNICVSISNYDEECYDKINIDYTYNYEFDIVPEMTYSNERDIKNHKITAKITSKYMFEPTHEDWVLSSDKLTYTKEFTQDYSGKITFKDVTGYTKEFDIEINCNPIKLVKPTLVEKEYEYNGEEQLIELNNFDEEKMNISGNARTSIGEQNVTISLKSQNYVWEDETDDDIVYVFRINKGNLKKMYSASNKIYQYDGELHGIGLNIEDGLNITVKYANGNDEYILDEMPQYSELGTYTIKYKIYKDENYNEIYGQNTLKIVESYVIGDINGDGKVNIKDWNRLYNHINETEILTGDQLLYADVNGDGKVNIKDWNRMYDHITEVNPLW